MLKWYHNVNSFAVVSFAYGCERILYHRDSVGLVVFWFTLWFVLKCIAVVGLSKAAKEVPY